ncbi:selenocysteine-specific elongation factor selB-like [Plasmodium falciparum NF54]|uniref:Selenocysteine-specific elongation factor, putative n=2 Tax=Plasmodium falciparum TaxID=5833 RepID=Q8I243_PLAF7|nr:selenocysteine-specific elongation factor, putative [Plasmodium falciparum 3D7]KAF4328287.1 selenocysteine-specific elongation factor selB-like [Plasmodium falciparum NF54]PKC48079.1 selenocysteine-specific elongation factor selB-like [Plasmodium falciparum NF54]CAD49059.1 selenocysteine-specific elongation factor, putative [Plasmodium falciparum 3D7]|eukprot:XP_001351031.1 selenocysteine-specific elongation factor selB homologue, putative [Plasmodium falciparum 3D7]
MININVGVLGHVDSGKTSLCKCLSQVLSTCALDKHKESKERGITIDLGFSSFYIKKKKKKKYDVNQKREIQTNLLNDQTTDQKESFLYCKREEKNDLHNIQYDKTNIEYNEEQNCYDYTNDKHHSNNIYFYDEEIIQICLVDCPGHHSLLKSIIMGSEITDIIILVIDINKGIQKQTIECLVLCKIINCDIIIVLNKIDLIPLHLREKKINLMKKKIQEAFYKFKSLQSLNYHIVSISANVKGKDNKDVEGDPPNLLSHDKKGVKILLSGDNKDLPILLSDDKKDPPILLNDDKKDPPNLLNDDKKDPPNLLNDDKKDPPNLLNDDKKDPSILLSDDKKDPPNLLNDDKKDPPNLLNDDKKDPSILLNDHMNEWSQNKSSSDIPFMNKTINIKEIINVLTNIIKIPEREISTYEDFYFLYDHSFNIKGKGTIFTGTVIKGKIKINCNVTILPLNETGKIKEIQSFKKNVHEGKKGSRLSLLILNNNIKNIKKNERGVIIYENSNISYFSMFICKVKQVEFYKKDLNNLEHFICIIGFSSTECYGYFFKKIKNKYETNESKKINYKENSQGHDVFPTLLEDTLNVDKRFDRKGNYLLINKLCYDDTQKENNNNNKKNKKNNNNKKNKKNGNKNEHSDDIIKNEHGEDINKNEHSDDNNKNEHGDDNNKNEHGDYINNNHLNDYINNNHLNDDVNNNHLNDDVNNSHLNDDVNNNHLNDDVNNNHLNDDVNNNHLNDDVNNSHLNNYDDDIYFLVVMKRKIHCFENEKCIFLKNDEHTNCRICLYGEIIEIIDNNCTYKKDDSFVFNKQPNIYKYEEYKDLKILKEKNKKGNIDKIIDEHTIICKKLFQSSNQVIPYIYKKIYIVKSTYDQKNGNTTSGNTSNVLHTGTIIKPFAKQGKAIVSFDEDISYLKNDIKSYNFLLVYYKDVFSKKKVFL